MTPEEYQKLKRENEELKDKLKEVENCLIELCQLKHYKDEN